MAKGLDYAFYPHPSTAAIKAYEATFVCRYVSSYAPNDSNGKNLLATEKNALLGAGLSIVIVAEEADGARMLGGSTAGVADAAHADAVTKALGMSGIPIYFACDWDASPEQQALIHAYLDGAASVIGRARIGIYGGYFPLKRALDAGKAAYAWQTFAWSGTPTIWDSRTQLRQVQNGVKIGGADCDRDVNLSTDYGQWPRPGTGGDPTITEGDTGPGVTKAQGRLNIHGADPTVSTDGSFGPATTTAARSFQGKRKLTADGTIGPITWKALNMDPTPPAGQLPAPTGFQVDRKRLPLQWDAVPGAAVTGYTVVAYGDNGTEYARTITSISQTWCVLNGLTPGWHYSIYVWANGGAIGPPSALLDITLPA